MSEQQLALEYKARELDAELSAAIERKSRPKPKPRKQLAHEAAAFRTSRNWNGAQPAHFVELYCWCHDQVYGCEPAELTGDVKQARNARMGAASAAKKMLVDEFEGNPALMAKFLDWVFKRETEREQWRRDNGRVGGRLTWAVVFAGRSVLTDYRAHMLRQR